MDILRIVLEFQYSSDLLNFIPVSNSSGLTLVVFLFTLLLFPFSSNIPFPFYFIFFSHLLYHLSMNRFSRVFLYLWEAEQEALSPTTIISHGYKID